MREYTALARLRTHATMPNLRDDRRVLARRGRPDDSRQVHHGQVGHVRRGQPYVDRFSGEVAGGRREPVRQPLQQLFLLCFRFTNRRRACWYIFVQFCVGTTQHTSKKRSGEYIYSQSLGVTYEPHNNNNTWDNLPTIIYQQHQQHDETQTLSHGNKEPFGGEGRG